MHFSELSANKINQTELVALLINMGQTFVDGINLVYRKIEGSCSMLILTEDGIICARDFLGRTPIVIGKRRSPQPFSKETRKREPTLPPARPRPSPTWTT